MILRILILNLLCISILSAQGRGESKKRNLNKDQYSMTPIEREYKYQEAQAEILAKTLSKNINKKSKCLIIHHPVVGNQQKHLARLLPAFKKGFGDKVTELKKVPIKVLKNKADDLLMEEAMMEMTAEDFNKVIKANKDCDVVISLVALPFSEDEIYAMDIFKMIEDPDKPGFWIKDPKIKYPTFGVFNGYIGNLEPLFMEKLIHAITLWKPNPTIDEKPVPKDVQKAFDKRYLTVTPETVDAVKNKYPRLFPKPKK